MKNTLREALKNFYAEQIEQLPQFDTARTVALYYALPDEVTTLPMLRRWLGVKRLALPVVTGGEMTFHEYNGPGCLVTGAFGIREPSGTAEVKAAEIDLMLVPGMAFDASGGRLGRGGGYYDRYLARPDATHIYKVGICPPHRLVEAVPAEPHDIKMDTII